MSEEHSAFVRPAWASPVFRDENGTAVEYGHRWRGEPPKWAYSATSNLHRFAPLHLMADALVSCLAAEYQVVVSEAADNVDVLDTQPPAFDRSARLSPEGASGESLTIIYTSYPGVVTYIGRKQDERFPACGCAACDDDVSDLCTDLEKHLLALPHTRLGWAGRK
jgi:hypothetical protein